MSLWVLDTDTLTLLLHHHPGVTAQALTHPQELVTVSIVTVQETFSGRYNKIKQARRPQELIAAGNERFSETRKSVPRPLGSGRRWPLPNGRGTANLSLMTTWGIIAAYGQLEASVKLLRAMPILSYDSAAAEIFAELQRTYRRLPRNDLQIASIAISHAATLVTVNFADFGQIDGLSLDDWTKS